MVTGVLTVLLPFSISRTPFSFSTLPPVLKPNPSILSSSFPSGRLRLRRPRAREGGPSWGSNAEEVRTGRSSFRDDAEGSSGKKEKRQWWSDVPDDGFDEDFDVFDDEPQQLWDRIWIFKVFRSYGYLLPAIVASMLLATGPKAFLMALAIPLGQSALSLVFDMLSGRTRERAGPSNKSRKNPASRYARDFVRWEDDEPGEPNRTKQRTNGAPRKGEKHAAGGYGGWDELDGRRDFRKSPASVRSPKATSDPSNETQGSRKEKLTRRGRNKEFPLLVRLLIAVFPFLGSWTKLL